MAKKKEMDQLTKDSIAAQKAGMSYGQWKALHPNTGEAPKPVEVDLERMRTCAICGRQFVVGVGKSKKYCGVDCSYEAERTRCREAYRRRMANENG